MTGVDPTRSLIRAARPLFLIGPPRSGTTILARLLSAHPRVLVTNETAVFLQLGEMIAKSAKGVTAGLLYGKEGHELWSQHLREHAPMLIESYYERLAREQGREDLAYWGEKHPHLVSCLDLLDSMYPEAMYVYALRDPRDAACSISDMNNVSRNSAIENWLRFSEGYEAFAATLDASRLISVKYEELVQDYEGTSEGVFERLGLDLEESAKKFIRKYKSQDAHQFHAKSPRSADFLGTSVGRWRRDMDAGEQAYGTQRTRSFLDKYGYDCELDVAAVEPAIDEPPPGPDPDEVIDFICNVCSNDCSAVIRDLDRESRSCSSCGSSVRIRSLIHLLSLAVYGESLPIRDFPVRPRIRGIDLSGWNGYARRLAHKLGYVNTYFHKKPFFDVTRPEGSDFDDLDFLISSDVFEHVVPPVARAFRGAYEVLKPGGTLILTVPYMNRIEKTIEHFPDLASYRIKKRRGEFILENRREDGSTETYGNLRFHGGPGETLEIRVFARDSLVEELQQAGFSDIRIHSENVLQWGIVWSSDFSLPVTARVPLREPVGP